MLIDQGFCVDDSFADLSEAAEGVFCRIWSFCRLSRRPSVRRENLPRWHRKATQEAFFELVAAGRVVVLADGTVQPLALEYPHAPVQDARQVLPMVEHDEEVAASSPALPGASSKLSRSEVARVAAQARWSSKHPSKHDAKHAEASMQSMPKHDADASEACMPKHDNAGASEKKEERKEEDKREGEHARKHAEASMQSMPKHAAQHPSKHADAYASKASAASPPPSTPGQLTALRDAHRATIPPWALQQVAMDAIGTGKRPDDVRAVWERFVDHWISDGKLSASWAAEWRKWLGNQRTFEAARAAEKAAKAPPVQPRVDLLAEAQKRQAAAANAVQPTKEELDEMIAAVSQKQGAA